MNLHKINYNTDTFYALQNDDFSYVQKNWHEYEKAKDDWLHIASCYCSLPINKFFIENGANPLDNNNENFFNAVYQNNLELVKFYVSLNCFSLIKEDFLGGPLTNAFKNDNVELLKFLLELGCDIHLDNDYAFNRGFAHNSKECITYILQNYDKYPVKYNPYESYNHKEMIKNNSYELCHFILSHFKHPLEFNFDEYLSTLLFYGKSEMFDVFIHHGLIDKNKFIAIYPQLLFNFSTQENLYEYIKHNYLDFINSAEDINEQKKMDEKIETIFSDKTHLNNRHILKELDKIISFQFNFPNENNPITIQQFQKLLNIPLFSNFINNKELFVHHALDNLTKGNNIDFVKHFFNTNMLNNEIIANKIVNAIKNNINEEFINEFMYIIFNQYQKTENHELEKIFIYFKDTLKKPSRYEKKFKI